jgi:hypothetical protein
MVINLKSNQALQVKKHISKFNIALVMIKYDMEFIFFYIVAKGSEAIGKVNNIL